MRVLVTDASGLTARQTVGRLRALGCSVGVLSSSRFALARWTSAVARVHLVPALGSDSFAWWLAARDVVLQHGYEVVLPTQEQVVAVSYAVSSGDMPVGVATAVPQFSTLMLVQDKVSAAVTLDRLGVPQPAHAVLASTADVDAWSRFPAYVKAPIGTASAGVRRVVDRRRLREVLESTPLGLALESGAGALVQQEVRGPLVMVQAVADSGRLVAFHANLRVVEGPRGGASVKESVHVPGLRDEVERLVRGTAWHGAMSLDVVLGDEPVVIDVNPRLVEPGNALRSGVDLVRALLDVAVGGHPEPSPEGSPGERTHQLLLALITAAQTRGRTGAWGEVLSAATRSGWYRGSHEELTPLAGDPAAAVPLLAVLALATVWPRWADALAGASVAGYAVTPEAWRALTTQG